MNMNRSLNITIISKLVALSQLFFEYAKDHKTKVVLHSILLVLSVYIVSSVKFKLLPLIPSILPTDITSWINFITSKISAFYLIGFMFYLNFKFTPIKPVLIKSIFTVVIITIMMWLFLSLSDLFEDIKNLFFPLSNVSAKDFFTFLTALVGIPATLIIIIHKK